MKLRTIKLSIVAFALAVAQLSGLALVNHQALAFEEAIDLSVKVLHPDYQIEDPTHSATISVPNPTITIAYENLSKLEIYDNGVLIGTHDITGADMSSGDVDQQLNLTPGPHVISVQGYDINGVATSFTRSVNINYDPSYTTPTFAIVVPSDNTVVSNPLADVKVQYTNISKLVFYVDGQEVAVVPIDDADQGFGSIIQQLGLTLGKHTITVRGYDQNGDLLSSASTITITYTNAGVPNTGGVSIGGFTLGTADYLISGIVVALFVGIFVVFIKRRASENQRHSTRRLALR